MKLGSLFDGIGGALLCARLSGIEPVWASEIEPFPIKVTKHHFPEVKHYGDITQMDGAKIEPVDIIVGGSPCQDLSVAGKRAGLEGERSGLFKDMVRIIKEMREATSNEQPRYMVWENVPGAFSSNGGEDFRAVLEETARIADCSVSIPGPAEWRNAGSVLGDGFSISWRTINAQYWGVPQRRRRIYLVADFRGQSAPKILFEQEDEGRYFAQSEGKRREAAGRIEKSPQELTLRTGAMGAAVYSYQRMGEYKESNKTSTQLARQRKDATDLVVGSSVRRLTPLECERLQGYPDYWTDIPGASDTARYKALGNSFAIPCALFVIRGIVKYEQP